MANWTIQDGLVECDLTTVNSSTMLPVSGKNRMIIGPVEYTISGTTAMAGNLTVYDQLNINGSGVILNVTGNLDIR